MEKVANEETLPHTKAVHHRFARVLIVEDDITMEPLWKYVIETASSGASIKWVTTEEAAEKVIDNRLQMSEEFDLIISDIFLSGSRTGIDLWKKYGNSNTQFLLMSAVSPTKFGKLVGDGEPAPLYVQKPLNPNACIDTISAMLLKF